MNAMDPKDRIIVALDTDSLAETLNLAEWLEGEVGFFKIGLQLITTSLADIIEAEGSEISRLLRQLHGLFEAIMGRIFWDGKWNDIPNTVAGAAKAIQPARVWAFNVHATAGRAAMEKAVEHKGDAKVFAVTILTSIDNMSMNELGIPGSIVDEVARLARMAQSAGVDGIIASPQEIRIIREVCGPEMLIVTPGVRPAGTDVGDQKRVMTPGEAAALGANYLVIGRPITGAPDPVEAARAIAVEIEAALAPATA